MHGKLAINQNFSGKDQKQKKVKVPIIQNKNVRRRDTQKFVDLLRHLFSEGKNPPEKKKSYHIRNRSCRYLSTETNGFSRTLIGEW